MSSPGPSSSDLSDTSRYGYDFVVATTQVGINATMLEFLASLQEPIIYVCFVADANGNPVQIDYETLKQQAKGSDPFNVPNGATTASSTDMVNLIGARFLAAFKAQLGVPRVPDPSSLPNIVQFGAGASSVVFNMMCSQFTICSVSGGLFGPVVFSTVSQDPSSPWIFESRVDLRLSTVEAGAYSTLPAAVQARIKNLGSAAFSVQQLLFDLSNAALSTVPTIQGLVPGTTAYALLEEYFIGAYFTLMAQEYQPLLGCSITQSSAPAASLIMTDFDFTVSPYVNATGQPMPNPTAAQQQLTTLNYLCAVAGDKLPPAVQFSWNWVDESDVNDHDGAVAINRNTLANYIYNQIISTGEVSNVCVQPTVKVTTNGLKTTYSWNLAPYQQPTVTRPATGTTVLTLHWSGTSSDQAGLNGDMGQMTLTNTYDLSVTFSGTTITVVQHLVYYLYVKSLATGKGGNIVDTTITDTYTIAVDAQGQLQATQTTQTTQNPNTPSVNKALNFFTDLNDISNDVASFVDKLKSTQLQSMPLSIAQSFIFPGGNSFVFKNAAFSQNGDLVSAISYADPTGTSNSTLQLVKTPALKSIAVNVARK